MDSALSRTKALSILIVSAAVLFLGILGVRASSTIVLIAAGTVAAGMAMAWGVKWDTLQEGIIRTITSFLPAILILLSVGMLIGSWIACGTVPLMIYYGLKIISPSWFLLASLLLCTVMSVSTGTSWGTIGTVGVALVGVSAGLGIPLSYTAGAIVTGAIFGDKLSPLSDTTVLASAVSGVYIFDHIKYMLWTTFPPFIIAVIMYTILGARVSGQAVEKSQIDLILVTLESSFQLNPILLLPPVAVLVLVLKGKPVLPTFVTGIVLASVMAVFLQGESLKDLSDVLYSGFSRSTQVAVVDKMLFRGGIKSMTGSIVLPIGAAIFGSPLRTIGVIDILLDHVKKFAKTSKAFLAGVFFLHSFLFMITASYYVTFVTMGPLVAPMFDRFKLHRANLSRMLEDTGTSFAPIVPWSVTGAFIAGTLGVATFDFALYAPLCYLGLVFSLGYILSGFKIASSTTVITEQGSKLSDGPGRV